MPQLHGTMIASFNGVSPQISGPLAYGGQGSVVLGRTTLGANAWLGDYAVLRGDGHHVKVGDDAYLGAHATVHIAHELLPAEVGERLSAGTGAVIHACTMGDDCVVEDGAVVLDGSTVGSRCVIAERSIVYPRSTLESGWLYAGSPAKPVAEISEAKLAARHHAVRSDPAAAVATPATSSRPDCFVAISARVSDGVKASEGVSIWYGCVLDAGEHQIRIGTGTNIQDNSFVFARHSDVLIGPDVTIGHNVTLTDCSIGSGCLIGIGARLSAGTVVEDGVLVAAGAETDPGQRLASGQVWGGRPARPIKETDDKVRDMLSRIPPTYRGYANVYEVTEHTTI